MTKRFEASTSDRVWFHMIRAQVVPDAVGPHDARFTGVGFAIVDGRLSIAIMDAITGLTLSARVDGADLDSFCGIFADHLTEVSPEAANAQMEAGSWPTMQ
jgi:hypothetical protein